MSDITRIDGRQLKALSITNAQISESADIATSKLADASYFIITGGSAPNTAMPSGYTPTAELDIATKGYVIQEVLSSLGFDFEGFSWQKKVLSIEVDGPPGALIGDRYLVSPTPTPAGLFDGQANKIATYDGEDYSFTTPETGFALIVEAEPQKIYLFITDEWLIKEWEATTAGVGLKHNDGDFREIEVKLNGADALSGLSATTDGLKVVFDGNSLDVSASGIFVKLVSTGGIEETESGLSLKLDGTTLSVGADGVKVTNPGLNNLIVGGAEELLYAAENVESFDIIAPGTIVDLSHVVLTILAVELNGVGQTLTADYTVSENGGVTRITFVTGNELIVGDKITVKYRYAV